MTIGANTLYDDTIENVTKNDGPNNVDEYKQVLKSPRAHERTIVGIRVFQNARNRQLTLVTFGHDSLKLWGIAAFEDDFSIFPIRTINSWNCGIQSFTHSSDGKKIFIVSTDCSLHHISLSDDDQVSPNLELVNNGIMEIWFCLSIPTMPDHFLTVNFQSIQLQIINNSGSVVSGATFEKAKQISSIAYGPKFIAIGTSQGVIFVVNSSTLGTLYSHEGHSMKVRCLEMVDSKAYGGESQEEEEEKRRQPQVLSGSDDKTIKLFALTDSRAQLERVFCGHKGIITGLAICRASGAQRFASIGADNCLILWEIESGQKLHIFTNCTPTLNDMSRSVCFTPNGRYLVAGTEESTILAYRVPQPLNYVEEPLEDMGKEEQGLLMGEGEEEENDENRMEFDEQQQGGSPDWENHQQYDQQQEYAEFDKQEVTQTPQFDESEEHSEEQQQLENGGNEEEEEQEEEQQKISSDVQQQANGHSNGVGEDEDWERRELEEQLGID